MPRPPKSQIRNNIAAILQILGSSYGYEIYKIYKTIFGNVKIRTLYYNLKQGVLTNEFIISDIKREQGQYTWGSETERVYYSNGPYATPTFLTTNQKQIIENYKTQENIIPISYLEQTEKAIQDLKKEIKLFELKFKKLTVNQRKTKYKILNDKITKLTNGIKNTKTYPKKME